MNERVSDEKVRDMANRPSFPWSDLDMAVACDLLDARATIREQAQEIERLTRRADVLLQAAKDAVQRSEGESHDCAIERTAREAAGARVKELERELAEVWNALDAIWDEVRQGVYGPPAEGHLQRLAAIRWAVLLIRA